MNEKKESFIAIFTAISMFFLLFIDGSLSNVAEQVCKFFISFLIRANIFVRGQSGMEVFLSSSF